MKEILIPAHEVDFTCSSYLHHGAGLRLTGPQSCDISFLLTSYGMMDIILKCQVVFVMVLVCRRLF
jgi:hypothetical protein